MGFLGEAHAFGKSQLNHIHVPWCGMTEESAGVLAQAVYNAGDGDYLEIGVAFGCSAVLVHRTKMRYKIKGSMYGVDPFAYYPNLSSEIPKGKYSVALIDGEHQKNDYPTQDWLAVSPMMRRNGYVLFHDYPNFDAVTRACERARNTDEWEEVYKGGGFFVVRRK